MRKNGWQLPYHPLQVVAISVFLALGFAFYVFFAPFVGEKPFQYAAIGFYTPLILCVFWLYILCAASDPMYPGVLNSKKLMKIKTEGKHAQFAASRGKPTKLGLRSHREDKTEASRCYGLPTFFSPGCIFNCSSSSRETFESEDGMFYCTLCKVVVSKHSKHCRVCDKCVDSFDHHCRWLNNCIGKKNYRKFFSLLVSALLLLIFQSATGILVLTCCFLEQKRFMIEIAAKLGSSFSIAPFAIVMVLCTGLAMTASLPLAQLLFFHILLMKKGISTYDYIVALREQEQEINGGAHSPQMSPSSSLTGLSSSSSVNTFRRAPWCTPPRLLIDDEFDAIPPGVGPVRSPAENKVVEEKTRKKNGGSVKINPWTLARLNGKEVSRVATEARKKSKVMLPVVGMEEDEAGRKRAEKRTHGRKKREKELEPNLLRECSRRSSSSDSSGMGRLSPEQRLGFRGEENVSISGSKRVAVGSSPETGVEGEVKGGFQYSNSSE